MLKKFITICTAIAVMLSMLPASFAQNSNSINGNVTFYNSEDEQIAEISNQQKIYAKVSFTAPQDGEAVVIAAKYNADGVLQDTVSQTVENLNAGETVEHKTADIAVSDADSVKIFVWDEYDNILPVLSAPGYIKRERNLSGSAAVSVSSKDGITTGNATVSTGKVSAYIPAGAMVNGDTDTLTLTVKELENTDSDVVAGENEVLLPIDIHIDGIAEDNTTPIIVTVTEVLTPGLNKGNLNLYHVENGQTVKMTAVNTPDELTAHNQFYYDALTGTIVLAMATFSEVVAVADTENAWNGTVNTEWYNTTDESFTIANADQLAHMGNVISSGDENYGSAHYKLTADINMGGIENYNKNGREVLFYPIGYNKVGGTTADKGDWYTYGGSFKGVFDGTGHTISGIYQNTWAMVGDYDGTYYNDAMGLFGYVNGGTVKNITIDNFYSEGEFAPTGCIAAYAVNSTFENIAITNCNPRVYNTGNGGIIGVAGRENEAVETLTLKNITVDKSNKISALWGSWDVACGGLVGMYRGNVDENGVETGDTISFENCHVAAQIDVNNDVCANYQYYAYRYAGMIIGSVRHNTKNEEGKIIPNMTGISAEKCTVNYGDWNNYYYCELVDNSLASYTHDHQFSRLTQVKSVDVVNKTYTVDERATAIPTEGRYDYVVVNGEASTENATCHHFVDGEVWNHVDAGNETVDGIEVQKEDKQHIYLPFNQLFTGHSWGVSSIGLKEYGGIVTDLNIIESDKNESATKFVTKFTEDFLYRVGNENTVALGTLFAASDGAEINNSGVYVTIDKVDENTNVSGTFSANTSDWTKGTIQFSGTGVVKVTIQDYDYCTPTELYLEVVDAVNAVTYSDMKDDQSTVMLNDITMSSDETKRITGEKTLYGNGFTFDVTDGAYTAAGYDYANYVVYLEDSELNNVKIVGKVYPEYGGTKDLDYSRAIVMTSGECVIANSYISNGASPIRNGGNLKLVNTTLKGGNYANLDLRNGHLTLDNVTTINQVSSNETTEDGKVVVGLGIVVYQEGGTEDLKITIQNNLTQYNYLSKTEADTNITNAYATAVTGAIFSTDFTDYQNEKLVNTGIISMNDYFTKDDLVDERTDKDSYFGTEKTVTQYGQTRNCYVYSFKPTKTVTAPDYVSAGQYFIVPSVVFDNSVNYNQKDDDDKCHCVIDGNIVDIEKHETVTEPMKWDPFILKATKFGKELDYTVTIDGEEVSRAQEFNETKNHTVVYTYTDPYNYKIDSDGNITSESMVYTEILEVNVNVKEEDAKSAEFSFGANGTAYSGKTTLIGDKTYVMPDVTATVDGKIGSTTVSGTTVYYPITEMFTSDGKTAHTGTWYACFPIFKDALQIVDYADGGKGDTVTYNQTTVTTVEEIPSSLEATNPTSAFLYSMNATNYPPPTTPTAVSDTVCYTCNRNGLTASNTRNEMTIIAEYTYTDNAGTKYYYYIGYHCAAQTNGSCVTPETLITLADGTQKEVQNLTGKEQLLVWNHETGKLEAAPIAYIVNHGKIQSNHEITKLTFEDGKEIEIIGEHVFFDANLNQYISLDKTAGQYIGHSFVITDGNSIAKSKLTKVRNYMRNTGAYEVVTYKNLTCFTNNILSASAYMDKLLNVFDIDSDSLKYIPEKVSADIQKYGLYSYEDFEGIIEEKAFELYNAKYLKIAVGKGYITWDDVLSLVNVYKDLEIAPISE